MSAEDERVEADTAERSDTLSACRSSFAMWPSVLRLVVSVDRHAPAAKRPPTAA